jgi:hypothetical protein
MARSRNNQRGNQSIDLIRPATIEDAFYVASHLQEDDHKELEGLGHTNMSLALSISVLTSDVSVTFLNPKGDLCGIAGVSRTDAHCGAIWMLTTPHVRPYPKLFFKEAKRWVDQITSYDVLHNIADPRNYLHMKLLHMLGFKKLMYRSVGPDNLTYVEFAKLTKCVMSQSQLLPSAQSVQV